MFPPLVTPPSDALDLEELEAFAVPRSVGRMVGEGRARDAVRTRVLGPADIDEAEMSDVEAIWLPLWRVEGTVDSFSVGLVERRRTTYSGPDVGVLGGPGKTPPRSPKKRRTTTRSVLPSGGFSHYDGVAPVLARGGFAIDPSRKVRIRSADLLALADAGIEREDMVLPDLPRAEAESIGKQLLSRRGRPKSDTLFAKVNVDIRDVRLCFYPLYVIRYRYGGEAVEGGPATFFAAVSGTTGKVVASQHPSGWRSVGGKLRRLFGG